MIKQIENMLSHLVWIGILSITLNLFKISFPDLKQSIVLVFIFLPFYLITLFARIFMEMDKSK